MSSRKVIVFGPTGAVGSSAARTAAALGAKVVLAMRDTKKAIPGLDEATEKSGSFERVSADLTKPDTVREAVQSTNAEHAFLYLTHGASDHSKATIQALKDGGIKLVVFLSSFTIQHPLKEVQPEDAIPYMHAQVEINLDEIFGRDNIVALRPGYFSSNTSQYKAGLDKGEVKIHSPKAKVDLIVPEDIGRVGGTVLARGPQDESRFIYLFGPELKTQQEAVEILAKVLGKSVNISAASDEEAYELYTKDHGVPPPLANYMVRQAGKIIPSTKPQVFGYEIPEEQLNYVEKYSGQKATTFEDWAAQNKQLYT